jgi:hypothetical protein
MNHKLLQNTHDQILAHPDQVNMTDWFLHKPPQADIAGHVVWLADGLNWLRARDIITTIGVGMDWIKIKPLQMNALIPRRAIKLLDISDDQARRLFYVTEWPKVFRDGIQDLRVGSPMYAAVVAQRIQSFLDYPSTT